MGYDVEGNGLFGAPSVDVVVGAEAHTTSFVADPAAHRAAMTVTTDGSPR